MKRLSLLLVALSLAGWTKASHSKPSEQTQSGLNATAGNELKTAEAEMTLLLNRLITRAAGKTDAIAKLTKAQTAWKTYRDSQIEAMWPFPERGQYGSVYPMCVGNELTKLTKARVVELRRMLNPVEGDVCASQWPE